MILLTVGTVVKVRVHGNPEVFRPFMVTRVYGESENSLSINLFDGILFYDGEQDKPYEFIHKSNLYFSSDKHSMLYRGLKYGNKVGDILLETPIEVEEKADEITT